MPICTERQDINKRCVETKPQKESAILRYFPVVSSLLLRRRVDGICWSKMPKKGKKAKGGGKGKKGG